VKLIPQELEDNYAIRMAGNLSAKYGFVALKCDDFGNCVLVPAHEVYALAKAQQEVIEEKINKIRKEMEL
jgi:hypothetical protein